MKSLPLILLLALCGAEGCVSTPPTPIGGDTYYSSKSTAGGEFGNTGAAVGHLIELTQLFVRH